MSTKKKWVIALFVIQAVAFIGLAVKNMAFIGSIAGAIGSCIFGIAGFIVWHYESIEKYKNTPQSPDPAREPAKNETTIQQQIDLSQLEKREEKNVKSIQNFFGYILCGILSLASLIGVILSVVPTFNIITFIIFTTLLFVFVLIPIVFYIRSSHENNDDN